VAYIHAKVICEHLRDVSLIGMKSAAPTGVGAKIIQLGDLTYFAAGISNTVIPIILIKPIRAPFDESEAGLLKAAYTLLIRIVYVRSYSEASGAVSLKIQDTEKIVEALWSDWLFEGITLDAVGSQISSSMVTDVDFEPEEDLFASALDESLQASAIEVETMVHVNRKQS